ncbi:MAG: M20/M25/M40 family metallo-hydrolase [Elusimicrobia bacterium]|nr:M20/M25/M40 family metallo-hydrolase [Elusimicrobiota bacterium]
MDKRFYHDARESLKALIGLDTSNPPGNEILAARYLKKQLDHEGIPSRILTSKGTRSSLITRLKGSGAKRPLILMNHTDVVPAERKHWSTDPFRPVKKGGYLYGRGTADIKSMTAVELAIMFWLKRSKVKLARDVIFFAEADEETGGPGRHIDWLLEKHGDLLCDAEFAVNEGGEIIIERGKISEIRIQVAEKEFVDIFLTARGSSGHTSIPRPDNAVCALARAVSRLSGHKFSAVMNKCLRIFLTYQAQAAKPALRRAVNAVLQARSGKDLDFAAGALMALKADWGAMLCDTIVPTILKAGYKSNVIPDTAEAVLNARLLPGTKRAVFVRALERIIAEPAIKIRSESAGLPPIGPMPLDTELYKAAQQAANDLMPRVRVMPYMAAWTTDAQFLRAKGVITYGIDPPVTVEDSERIHGNNERIHLGALDSYARYLLEIVLRVAAPDYGGSLR